MLGQISRPLSISSLIGEKISKSLGRKRVNFLSSPMRGGFMGSPLPNKIEKSDKIIAFL